MKRGEGTTEMGSWRKAEDMVRWLGLS